MRVRGRARERVRERVCVCERERERVRRRACACVCVRVRAGARARACVRACLLRACVSARATVQREEYVTVDGFRADLGLMVGNCRTYNQGSNPTLVSPLTHTRARTSDRVHARTHARAYTLARGATHSCTRARARDHAHAHVLRGGGGGCRHKRSHTERKMRDNPIVSIQVPHFS